MLPTHRDPKGNLAEEVLYLQALQQTLGAAAHVLLAHRKKFHCDGDDCCEICDDIRGVIWCVEGGVNCLETQLLGSAERAGEHLVDIPDGPPPTEPFDYLGQGRFTNWN